jgi:predicted Zn-dependent protease
LAEAVAEVTVAGNLKDMFRTLTPANNLTFRYGTNVPTLRVDGMTPRLRELASLYGVMDLLQPA